MKLRSVILGVMACCSLALGAAASAQIAPIAPAPMQQGSGDQLEPADQDFLENAAQAGTTEIEGSKLAQIHAHSADVKTFANQMVMGYTRMAEELDVLAKAKGHTLPTEPSVMQQATLKTLDLRDESFDEKYASHIGVSVHEDAIKLFQQAATGAKDPDVKAFATTNLPILQQHLEAAKALEQKLSAEK